MKAKYVSESIKFFVLNVDLNSILNEEFDTYDDCEEFIEENFLFGNFSVIPSETHIN